MRWLNCVVFKDLQDFEKNVEKRNNTFYFSHCAIFPPDKFPAYFELKDGYENYWGEIDSQVILSRWDAEIENLQKMRDKLEKIMLDKSAN